MQAKRGHSLTFPSRPPSVGTDVSGGSLTVVGTGIAMGVDHLSSTEVKQLADEVRRTHGHIDILVPQHRLADELDPSLVATSIAAIDSAAANVYMPPTPTDEL